MLNGINNLSTGQLGNGAAAPVKAGATTGASFADTLKGSIDEVSRLQQDASKAIDEAMTGKAENLTGVMTAVEKSELAFKTLLAIRTKLMDAYEEIKNIPI